MAQRTIVLKGKLGRRYDEARMAVAGFPGYLIFVDPLDKYRPHATAGAKTVSRFLVEDDFQGKTINDVYAIDALGRSVVAEPGDIINCVLKFGTAAVVRGDPVTSNGDGTIRKQAAAEWHQGYAESSLDLSAAGANDFLPVYIA